MIEPILTLSADVGPGYCQQCSRPASVGRFAVHNALYMFWLCAVCLHDLASQVEKAAAQNLGRLHHGETPTK